MQQPLFASLTYENNIVIVNHGYNRQSTAEEPGAAHRGTAPGISLKLYKKKQLFLVRGQVALTGK